MIRYLLPDFLRAVPRRSCPATIRSGCYLIAFVVMMLGNRSLLIANNAREANRSFQEGRYDDALEIYRHLSLKHPDDPRFTYNAGVSAFRAGQLTEALEHFDAASLAPDLALQQQAHYNMANTLFRAGEAAPDFEQKMAAWRQASQRYEHALTIDEADSLAEDNLNFVKRRIEELEQQQEQQQQDQEQQDQNEDQDESSQDQQSDSEQKDQEDQDQSDQQDPGDQEDKQEQSSQQDQQQQNEQQRNQQEQQQEQQQQQDQKSQDEQQQDQAKEPNPDDKSANQGQPREGQMTPEQAKQLLDAERDQAQAMIFRPPETRRNRNRKFKDW